MPVPGTCRNTLKAESSDRLKPPLLSILPVAVNLFLLTDCLGFEPFLLADSVGFFTCALGMLDSGRTMDNLKSDGQQHCTMDKSARFWPDRSHACTLLAKS